MLPFVMLATYTTIYGVLPFYLRKKKLLISVVLEIALIFLVTLAERIFLRKLNSLEVTFDSLFGITFLYLMLETNFMVGIAFAIKFLKKWFVQQNESHETEKQNLKSELNLLKAQLHPHFLFNTMNNLYALSLEESGKTSEGIAKMSELLRLVLYECNEAEIPLSKEIQLIQDYIDLEKLRYDKRLHVSFDISGNYEQVKIAPMLFFTFVENCFKHGSRNDPEKPYILIKIEVDNAVVRFFAENSKPEINKSIGTKIGGIGLKNVRKRLKLIYGKNYNLEITNSKEKFVVSLVINRNEPVFIR